MPSRGWLAALSVLIAVGALAGYFLLLHVAIVRNHPEAYVVAFAIATALAGLALVCGRGRRWPAWIALGLSSLLLLGGAWFNLVGARVPVTPVLFQVGQPPPDFTLTDAAGRPVSLADYRGRKPVVLVFYRGYW